MTVNYSLDLNLKLRPKVNRVCRSCGLYLNQLPVFEQSTNPHVFWVGLSAVQFNEGNKLLPLSPSTRTGKLIEGIEHPLRKDVNFYKTNLVKCLPLYEGKIRYPSTDEMEKCYPNFLVELDALKPKVVFLLGLQVSSFIMNKVNCDDIGLPKGFKYKGNYSCNTIFVPIHHPSYVLIYKRKEIEKYVKSLQLLVKKLLLGTNKTYNLAS